MNTQAQTDNRNTTEAVTNTERFLRCKILRRSRNVGSLSGKVLNWSPLPTLKCVLRGPDNALSCSKTISEALSLLGDASYKAASASLRGRAVVYFHVQWEQPGPLSG